MLLLSAIVSHVRMLQIKFFIKLFRVSRDSFLDARKYEAIISYLFLKNPTLACPVLHFISLVNLPSVVMQLARYINCLLYTSKMKSNFCVHFERVEFMSFYGLKLRLVTNGV